MDWGAIATVSGVIVTLGIAAYAATMRVVIDRFHSIESTIDGHDKELQMLQVEQGKAAQERQAFREEAARVCNQIDKVNAYLERIAESMSKLQLDLVSQFATKDDLKTHEHHSS